MIAEGRISALAHAGETIESLDTIDVSGQLVVPGFIDLQLNGGWGHDFTTDPGSIGEVAGRLPEFGVTAFLPTIVTSATGRTAGGARRVWRAADRLTGAAIPLGLHFEGPSISPEQARRPRPALGRPAHRGRVAAVVPRQRRRPRHAGAGGRRRVGDDRVAGRQRRVGLGGSQRVLAGRVRAGDTGWREHGDPPVQRHVAVLAP